MIVYSNMVQGRFLARPNRFVAYVELAGQTELCHVKNTGRCRELLLPGAPVWCQHHEDPGRKTAWSLITVQKGKQLVNLDSQAPNWVAREYLEQGGLGLTPDLVWPERVFGQSRFDLYYEAGDRKGFVEVKGVTLEENGVARFPDAPTERGRKHLRELQAAAAQGYEAWALFVIQMSGILWFEPNDPQDPAFGAALRQAAQNGVQVRAVSCHVTPSTLKITAPVEVRL